MTARTPRNYVIPKRDADAFPRFADGDVDASRPARMDKFIPDTKVAEILCINRNTVWRWARRGILPPAVRLGPSVTRWNAREIAEFQARREAEAYALQSDAETES